MSASWLTPDWESSYPYLFSDFNDDALPISLLAL